MQLPDKKVCNDKLLDYLADKSIPELEISIKKVVDKGLRKPGSPDVCGVLVYHMCDVCPMLLTLCTDLPWQKVIKNFVALTVVHEATNCVIFL